MKKKQKGPPRKTELVKHRNIALTQKGYELLRGQKYKQQKSMMRIIDNLIKEKYESK